MRKLLPYALLLAEVLVFFRFALFDPGYVFPWDIRYFHYPHAWLTAESFGDGALPLWDPYTYFGRPFQANIQAEVCYPPHAAAILLSGVIGRRHLFRLLEWEVALHVWLAGVFTFWMLRRFEVSRPAALVGASIYQLGGFFAAHVEHMGAVSVAAWIPLAWLAVIALAESRRWLPVLAIACGMAVLGGLTPLTAVAFGSTLLLATLLAAFGRAPWRLLGITAVGIFWGLLLAAVQFLPTIQLSGLSIAEYRTDWLKSGGGVPLQALVSLVWPNYYHLFDLSRYSFRWELTFMYLYCSLAGLLLALYAAVWRRHKEARLFAVLTVLCALAMLGDSTPIGRTVYFLLPAAIRNGLHPEYTLPCFILGMAVLAGIGAHSFLERRSRLGYPLVAVVALDLVIVGSGRPMNRASLAQEPGVTHNQMHGNAEIVTRLRQLTNQTFPPSRIDTIDATQDWAMAAPLLGLFSTNGNDPMALARAIQVRLAFCRGERWGSYYQVSEQRLSSPVLGLVNLRYLLSGRAIDAGVLERGGFREVPGVGGVHLYENTRVLPRFFLVGRIAPATGMEDAARRLRTPDFDPRVEAIVEGALNWGMNAGDGQGQVTVLEYKPESVLLAIDSAAPAYLVSSESHYPGWHAWVDGKPEPLYYTNVAFRGLPVPAGRHRVMFRFTPPILALGAGLSAVGWLLLFGTGLVLRLQKTAPAFHLL